MNRKQFLFVLVATAIIGSAGLVLINRHRESWAGHESKAGDKIFAEFQFNDVAAIHIKGKSELHIVRDDGTWRVRERDNYAANYPLIKDLLFRMRDLKIVRSETVGPSQLSRVNLEAPGAGESSGTLIEFANARGKQLGALLIGKRHLRPESRTDPFRLKGIFDGCYVLNPSEPENVLLISDELVGVSPEPGAWLDRQFFKIENLKSISLLNVNGENLWTLSRQDASRPWSLADAQPGAGEVLNGGVANEIGEALAILDFADVAPINPDSRPETPNERMIFAETFERFFYTLKIGGKNSDGKCLLTVSVSANISDPTPGANDELEIRARKLREKFKEEQALSRWAYLIESPLIETITRERTQLLQTKAIAGNGDGLSEQSPFGLVH